MTEPVLGAGDPVSALVEWLTADTAIAEIVGEDERVRIFGWELPLVEASHMPRAALVVSAAGGFSEGLPEVLDRARIDMRAYGGSHDEAMRLAVLVRRRMRELRRFVSSLGLVLHAPVRAGGYIPLREQSGGWPLVLRSYFQPFDETLVA